MKTYKDLIKHYLFWLLFFAINRLVFIVYYFPKTKKSGFLEILSSFYHALYLDTSASCYLLGVSFFLILIYHLSGWRFIKFLNFFIVSLFIVIISIITAAELGVYQEWGSKLNYKALSYIANPSEIIHSTTLKTLFIAAICIITLSFIGCWLYQKMFKITYRSSSRWYITLTALVIAPPLIFLGIRGGLQPIPINQSSVYFSKNNFINLATVNSVWNLGDSFDKNQKYLSHSPYKFYDEMEAQNLIKNIISEPLNKNKAISILKKERPNVILIILESWSADMIESISSYSDITPKFREIQKNGLFFNNMYATGMRSDQGMAAIFSGYPAQPTTSIIKQASKYEKLPCLNKSFKDAGYQSGFLFGGQLNYGNIKGYMYYNQFDVILEEKDFPNDVLRGRLGVHDEFVLDKCIDVCNSFQEPFFCSTFTLSSHSPYDQPMEDVLDWGENENGYINSVYYADQSLGKFITQAKKQPWYSNTLFVFIADHSHNSPKNWHIFSKEYRKIPMLIYGEPLKDSLRGKEIDLISSQIDLSKTLLNQLNLNSSEFVWSKDLLNSNTKGYAYYEADDGLGWVEESGSFVYHKTSDRFYQEHFDNESKRDSIIKNGKSYLQVLFDDYLNY